MVNTKSVIWLNDNTQTHIAKIFLKDWFYYGLIIYLCVWLFTTEPAQPIGGECHHTQSTQLLAYLSPLLFFFFKYLDQAWTTFSRNGLHETWLIYQVGHTTKNIQGNFTLKIPLPFSLQKFMYISISLRNMEKMILHPRPPQKNIFSIKKKKKNLYLKQAIWKALQATCGLQFVHDWPQPFLYWRELFKLEAN